MDVMYVGMDGWSLPAHVHVILTRPRYGMYLSCDRMTSKPPGGRKEIRGCTVEDEGLHSIYQSTCREGAHVV